MDKRFYIVIKNNNIIYSKCYPMASPKAWEAKNRGGSDLAIVAVG